MELSLSSMLDISVVHVDTFQHSAQSADASNQTNK